jgi:hypothetical protein
MSIAFRAERPVEQPEPIPTRLKVLSSVQGCPAP